MAIDLSTHVCRRHSEAQCDCCEMVADLIARAERAECACLVLAPIALPTLVKQARDRIDRNPPRSDGFEDAAAHFAAVLRLRQAMRQLELTA